MPLNLRRLNPPEEKGGKAGTNKAESRFHLALPYSITKRRAP